MRVEVRDGAVLCAVFALCDNPAEGAIEHSVLGAVPACRRCADRLGFTLLPAEFEFEVEASPERLISGKPGLP